MYSSQCCVGYVFDFVENNNEDNNTPGDNHMYGILNLQVIHSASYLHLYLNRKSRLL
jgi:hypothetical protein